MTLCDKHYNVDRRWRRYCITPSLFWRGRGSILGLDSAVYSVKRTAPSNPGRVYGNDFISLFFQDTCPFFVALKTNIIECTMGASGSFIKPFAPLFHLRSPRSFENGIRRMRLFFKVVETTHIDRALPTFTPALIERIPSQDALLLKLHAPFTLKMPKTIPC